MSVSIQSDRICLLESRSQQFDDRRVYAVVEIQVSRDWRPRKADSYPAFGLQHVPQRMLAALALRFNGSEEAFRRKEWAILTANSIFLITNIEPSMRPSDPAAFLPNAVTGLGHQEAWEIMIEQNHRRNFIEWSKRNPGPGRWTIAIKSLTDAVERNGRQLLTVRRRAEGGFR